MLVPTVKCLFTMSVFAYVYAIQLLISNNFALLCAGSLVTRETLRDSELLD